MTVPALSRPLRDPLGDRVADHLARHAVRQAQTMLGLLHQPPPSRPLSSVRTGPPPQVVLGFGLGCDSSAILARWLTDPSSRDFPLHELAVIHRHDRPGSLAGMRVLPKVMSDCRGHDRNTGGGGAAGVPC